MFARKELNEQEVPAVRDLFERIIAAEADRLTDEQMADPRRYLTTTWREAAETVMRPLHRIDEMAEDLRRKRDEAALDPTAFAAVFADDY